MRDRKSTVKFHSVLAVCLGLTFPTGAVWAQNGTDSSGGRSPVRGEVAVQFGDRTGADLDGYRLGGFSPLWGGQRWLVFADGNGVLNENSSDFAGDIGLGYRELLNETVFGGNVYYNYRELGSGASSADFSTLGFGLEALSPGWAFRANAFFGLDGAESFGGGGFQAVTPRYVQEVGGDAGVQNILLGMRTDRAVEALDGADLTLTRKLPALFSEVGGGVYFLDTDGGEDSAGGQLIVDCSLTRRVTGHLNVTHDDLFDTSVFGAISFYIGGPTIDVQSRSESAVSRLWSRVRRRRVTPVLTTDHGVESVFATDATTGDLISVTQVDTGDDIVSHPDRLEADGDYVDIILADPGSTFSTVASIALHDDQRFLSAHRLHLVDTTELGEIVLPESNLGGAASSITAAAGIDAVTLADRNEVHGFFFDTSAYGVFDSAIAGSGANDFNILHNQIEGAGIGISLDAAGLTNLSGTLTSNLIAPAFAGDARRGVYTTGENVFLQMTDNEVTGHRVDNLVIEATGEVGGSFVGNTFSGATQRSGFRIETDGDVSASVRNNVASDTNQSGFEFLAGGSITSTFDGNVAHGNRDNGIHLFADTDGDGNGDYQGTVSNNAAGEIGVRNLGNGILVQAQNVAGTFSGNQTHENSLNGLRVEAINDLNLTVEENAAHGNRGSAGISLFADSDFDRVGDFDGTISGNAAGIVGQGNVNEGIEVIGVNVDADLFDNVTMGNGSPGLGINSFGNTITHIYQNTSSDNANEGISVVSQGSISAQIHDNVMNDNGDGLELAATGDLSGLIENNTANGNGGNWAFQLHADTDDGGDGDFLATFRNNTSIGSSGGIYVTGDTIGGQITSNTITDSTLDTGILLLGNRFSGLLSGNTSNNGAYNGVEFDVTDIGGEISSNVANGNDGAGFSLYDGPGTGGDFTADVIGNTANGNDGNGFHIEADQDFLGNFSGNTAIGNAGTDYNTTATGTVSGTTSPNTSTSNSAADFTGTNPIATP